MATRTKFQSFCDETLLAELRRLGLDNVESAFAYRDGDDFTRENLGHRQWMKLTLTDPSGRQHVMFMKRYLREPLKWRWQRLKKYGWRKSPAGVEFDNIKAANLAGIETIRHVVCGEEFDTFGARRSFAIVSAVEGEALEQCFETFLQRADEPAVRGFTLKLADLVRRFHEAGFAHRDLYSSHVFMSCRDSRLQLALIDLARMFRPTLRRRRWQVKDLGQLKYSMPQAWLDKWWNVFLLEYCGSDQPRAERLDRAVSRKVTAMKARIWWSRLRRGRRQGI